MCTTLSEISCLETDQVINSNSHVALNGFVSGVDVLKKAFSDDRDNKKIKEKPFERPKPLLTPLVDKYGNISIEVYPLEQFGGQSGGNVTSTNTGEPVGILKQGNNYDEEAVIIPMKSVCGFVLGGNKVVVAEGRGKKIGTLKRYCESDESLVDYRYRNKSRGARRYVWSA